MAMAMAMAVSSSSSSSSFSSNYRRLFLMPTLSPIPFLLRRRRLSCVPSGDPADLRSAARPNPNEDDADLRERFVRTNSTPAATIGGGGGGGGESATARDFVTLAACAVGLLTGLGVVFFNIAVSS